uniref:Uncharacterized protein n=1 Tax=Oryza barthii TaxID=65489 RepID=A0A0D3HFM4_9ORYZ
MKNVIEGPHGHLLPGKGGINPQHANAWPFLYSSAPEPRHADTTNAADMTRGPMRMWAPHVSGVSVWAT